MPWSCTKRYMCSVHGMSRAVESPGAAPEQPSWAPNGKPREGDARAPVGRFHGHSGHPMELMHPPARGPQWEPSKRSAQATPLLPQPAASTLSNLGPNPHRSAVNPPPPAPSTTATTIVPKQLPFPISEVTAGGGVHPPGGGGDFGRAHPEVLPVPELRARDPTKHWGRGFSARAARDQSAEHSPGLSGGGGRREMKRSKVLRVRTRELERIRWQLGKGGGEGREQQRSAERNVLMGRQPERQPGPPPPPLLPKAV